jgi:Arc/MetJ-type ribon-helix-helix transcriptional regulator
MTAKKEVTIQTSMRMPKELADRIDKLVKTGSQDGFRLTQSDVIRMALFRGVDQMETERKKK